MEALKVPLSQQKKVLSILQQYVILLVSGRFTTLSEGMLCEAVNQATGMF
jgi:hypothetical protein